MFFTPFTQTGRAMLPRSGDHGGTRDTGRIVFPAKVTSRNTRAMERQQKAVRKINGARNANAIRRQVALERRMKGGC